MGKPLVPTWYGSVARNNPFDAPGHLPYSTYSDDVTIDAATLDLYFAVIEEGTSGWNDRSGAGAGAVRTYTPHNHTSIRCIYIDAVPDGTCIDIYVDTYLTRGVYFRVPTDGERQRFRDHLAALLANEADPADRPNTMRKANSAADLGRALKSRLKAQGVEAERWKAEAEALIGGLAAAIDGQFERWQLSPAESEVALLLKGLSHREVAEVRSIGEATARQQARAVDKKAGLSGRHDLAAFFLEDLLQPRA